MNLLVNLVLVSVYKCIYQYTVCISGLITHTLIKMHGFKGYSVFWPDEFGLKSILV